MMDIAIMLRPIRFLIAGSALAAACLGAVELSGRLDPAQWVLPVAPLEEAAALAARGRWAEAGMLAELVAEHPNLGDRAAAAALARSADLALNSFQGRMRRFAHGAASGEPTDGASLLGSLSLDLFVVGDIRDLAVQGWKEVRYGEGDTVILALSGVGLATTLAPQLDWAPALLKALKRSGALTRGFLRSLRKASRAAVRRGDFTALAGITADTGRAARHLGPGPLRGAMRAVDSAGDLARVARGSQADARGTYAIARLFGNRGVKRISSDGRNVGRLVTTMKSGSRLGKIAKKSLGGLPTSWVGILLAAALLIAARALWPRRRQRLPLGERIEPRLGPSCRATSTSTPIQL